MLRDHVAGGGALPEAVIRRWGLDLAEPAVEAGAPEVEPAPLRPQRRAGAAGLAGDVLVNDRTGDVSCANCSNRPLGQAETSIASLDGNLLAGWNDAKGFCVGAVQGYGYSTDNGVTWVDAGDVPALPTGGRWRGDPVHTVNRKTGDFYICGIYEGGAFGFGLAVLRGHFAAGTFVVDLNQQIAVGGADFLDKPWIACDSLSGNLYVTYSNFVVGVDSQIELIRSTDNGVSWSAPLVLSSPAAFGWVQSSRPAVGPDGELYVVWDESASPQNHMRIRRSDDFGGSFGPERTAADVYENDWSGAPGFRRGFGFTLPGIAVDATEGPHRGRVYVSWDEAVNFEDAPLSAASIVTETENDGFFASAVPFTLGQGIRGSLSTSGDVDLYGFSGVRGETIFCATDSATANTQIDLRLVCSADTASFNTIRSLALCRGGFPAVGFTLPADGVYYLRIVSAVTSPLGSYRILTAVDTPTAGERASDHRDQFVAYSDDGATWSAPARVNDSDPWFDGIFPEITVDGTGAVHAYWHDFRDDPACGALSFEYLVSSDDGGVTWGPNQALSDVSSFWSTNVCGSANQGDYQGITSEGATVYPCWTDARLGDPDVFMERAVLTSELTCAPADTAEAESLVVLPYQLTNTGNVDQSFAWQVLDDHGWLESATPAASGSTTLPASGALVVEASLRPPAGCSPALTDTVRFVISDLSIPGRADTCVATLTCVPGPVAVEPGPHGAPRLALEGGRPNPASGACWVSFTLASAEPARLDLVDAVGRRVARREVGALGAGRHVVRLADDRALAPGVYLIRLVQGGTTLTEKFTVLR